MTWPPMSAAPPTVPALSHHRVQYSRACYRKAVMGAGSKSNDPQLPPALDPPRDLTLISMGLSQHQLVSAWLGALTVIHLRDYRRQRHYQQDPRSPLWMMKSRCDATGVGRSPGRGAREITPRETVWMTLRRRCLSGIHGKKTARRRTPVPHQSPRLGPSVW
jgi:hypothetical protein